MLQIFQEKVEKEAQYLFRIRTIQVNGISQNKRRDFSETVLSQSGRNKVGCLCVASVTRKPLRVLTIFNSPELVAVNEKGKQQTN